MFFSRKKKLRKEFDEKLLNQLEILKHDWNNQRTLMEKSFDPSDEFIAEAKLAEAKYFYLFKEAKERKVSLKKIN
ncbi:YaaL family protein [Bacillus massilinigeriensis]|uniref:YaaL family protein n=1 Tax=Bacillus mediterraneensis TaxID=1805474 RepID=UPI0008F8E318|nr:YaaL family protein [Bacillus mediterraneensis]